MGYLDISHRYKTICKEIHNVTGEKQLSYIPLAILLFDRRLLYP
jgi:hypothetical protein